MNYKNKYKKDTQSMHLDSVHQLLDLLNQLKGIVDFQKSTIHSNEVRLITKDGHDHGSIGNIFTREKLLGNLSKIFGVDIDSTRSKLTAGGGFALVFNKTPPFRVDTADVIAPSALKNNKKKESKDEQASKVIEATSGQGSEEDVSSTKKALPEGVVLPDWKLVQTKNKWSKKKIVDLGKSLGIELSDGAFNKLKTQLISKIEEKFES